MGSACCVAARDRTLVDRNSYEAVHRNVRYSPSWSFRWDNRGRVAGEVDNLPYQFSHGINRSAGFEQKSRMNVEIEDALDGESPRENLQTPTWQESPTQGGATGAAVSDQTMGSNLSPEAKGSTELSSIIYPSEPKLSFPIPSTSSSLLNKAHVRQVSNGQNLGFKSPNNSVSEGRPSFVLSMCSNDLTMGSHGGSSDGWSLRTFSELVASSHKESWSLDSDSPSSGHGKITRSNSHLSSRPSLDLQICGVCSKLLTERSLWSSQKIIANNELPIVSVLVCGHTYHAECLENITIETNRYDPSCPVCVSGDKQVLKMFRKGLRAQADLKARNKKISRTRDMDSGLDAIMFNVQNKNRREEKGPTMGTSSSSRSSFGRPFLRRHFSLGSKSAKSMLDNDTAKRKGFWARYR